MNIYSNIQRIFWCLSVLLLLFGVSIAHPGGDHNHSKVDSRDPNKLPDFEYDQADVQIKSTLLGKPLEYDSDILSVNGTLWFTWVEFLRGQGDRIWIGQRKSGVWLNRSLAISTVASYSTPKLTVDANGQIWLSYEAEQQGQWDVFAIPVNSQDKQIPVRKISRSAGADIHHEVAADSRGGLWFIWQSDRDGQFDIVSRLLEPGKEHPVEVVSRSSRGDWHPDLAIDSQDQVHAVWDGFDGTSFNVYQSTFRNGQWQPTLTVSNHHTFEGRPSIAVDHSNRVWVAWEEGSINWGRPFRANKNRTEKLTSEKGSLHMQRQLHVAWIKKDGTVHNLDQQLPMPSRERAAHRKHTNRGANSIGSYYERVRITVDKFNRLWVCYRHNYCPWLGIVHRSHRESGFGIYARHLTKTGWSSLYQFDIGQGDGMQSLEIVPHKNGIAAVWTTGRTHRIQNKRLRGIVSASIEQPEPKRLTFIPKTKPRPLTKPILKNEWKRPQPATVNKLQYQLFYGDLHRHTDISLCRVPLDGTIDDAYRYATEVAHLDFLGITDHSRDIAQGDVESQLWWRSQKEVNRHELGTTFFPFFAYERSHGNTADHNVISLRNNLLRPFNYSVPEFWKELDSDTITIPHQPIRRDTWKYQNDKLRPLVEIFQGCRDNSIEKFVHQGLNKGYHLGFIASSDHMSTSASYACVWAKHASRESIFRALQARRTFAATTNIRLVMRVGPHWMGERIQNLNLPPVTLEADGTTVIEKVHLVIDGQTKKSYSPQMQHVEIKEPLNLTGSHYIYFHLIQRDGNEAWSSPIWIEEPDSTRKP